MIALLIIYGLLALAELFLVISFANRFKTPAGKPSKFTEVSVLVCARNEEENLPAILDSLLASDHDLTKIEILVGDDNSTDGTKEIISQYAHDHDCITYVHIAENKDGLIAKGNVLAQLVDLAEYEKVLIIDADMKVSKCWLSTMAELLDKNDLISGLTMVDKDFYRPRAQFFDWAVVLHTMKTMSDMSQPISILGNNMGFKRTAYEKVGGFKALGPTDVEDLALLRRFQSLGLKTFQYVGSEGKAFTKGQDGWKAMIQQRCRWMNGVFTHHWLVGIPALFARLWFVIALSTWPFSGTASAAIMIYGLLFNSVKYFQLTAKANNRYIFALHLPALISLLDTFALIRILLFGKVTWKGREFKK